MSRKTITELIAECDTGSAYPRAYGYLYATVRGYLDALPADRAKWLRELTETMAELDAGLDVYHTNSRELDAKSRPAAGA